MGVWQGVAMDSLKFYLGLPCPTFLRPMGGQPRFKGAHPQNKRSAAVFYTLWTPHAIRLWMGVGMGVGVGMNAGAGKDHNLIKSDKKGRRRTSHAQ
jgi:hypothetical protein